jgi:8-amino-7-oxononanoate synthase
LHPLGESGNLPRCRRHCQSACKEEKALVHSEVIADLSDSPEGADTLERELAAGLAELARAGRRRSLPLLSGRLGPRMRVGGREVCLLAGSNGLDLAADPRVLEAAEQALREHGAAAGGARLICGNLPVHEALERELAALLKCEAALLFSTGYMANLGVISALAGPGDRIASDRLSHASIIDACRLSGAQVEVFAHGDPQALHAALARGGARRRLVVLDGVTSMDGDVAPLAELVAVAREHRAVVVLDDTHGIGVLGARGAGTSELCGVRVDAWVGNLGKAFGSFGGFVAGSALLREWLLNSARSFIFSCALPPASAAAARRALAIAAQEPWRRRQLLERAAQLRTGLRERGFDTGASNTHIVPVLAGSNERALALAAQLLERGVYAQAIRYPSVPLGAARLRLAPMCSHSAADIDAALAIFAELGAAP